MTFKIYNDPDSLYFVTMKIAGGKHIFSISEYRNIVLNSLDYLRRSNVMFLFAFVIMPNHLHFMVKPRAQHRTSDICASFRRFTAHKIIKQAKIDNNSFIAHFHKVAAFKKDRRHTVWQDCMAKNILHQRFLEQKLNYIHTNPTSKYWCLTQEPEDYKYSSACFYYNGVQPIIDIDDLFDDDTWRD